MHRSTRLLVLACLTTLLLPVSAAAASRMYVGFQDDVSFRWADDRMAALDRAQAAGSTVIRTTLYWYRVAPERPANASDPFDPAYRFDDVDELVRGAQERGIEVMLTIWGTPEWANGGKGPNYLPTNLADLTAFAKAIATRYSGRFSDYPFVRFYTVGNESNLEQFLAPQFDAQGKSVGPALYAKMYRAAYAGIKAGSPSALVGVGETSPRGRDKPSPGTVQNSHSPGRFAELVAKARPRIRFDAWAHHPYPTSPNQRPTQRVRWPNVTLTQMERFESSLQQWFGRRVPIWITEYGHETKPEEPKGVSRAAQTAYAGQALAIVRSDEDVQLFIWFILRDDFTTSLSWQSGLYDRNWTPKPSLSRFAALARVLDARNAILSVRGGASNPTLAVSALELRAHNPEGTTIGINYSLTRDGRFLGNAIANAPITRDGRVLFRPQLSVRRGQRYVVGVRLTDKHGNTVTRTLEVRGV